MFRAIAIAAALFATPAAAAELSYTATLDGVTAPTNTGSLATGTARVSVNTEAQTVSVHMQIHGVTLDQLWDHVIHAGMGPVHLHLYAADGDISLLVPFPYGATYAGAPDGFTLSVENYSYAEGAALLQSDMSFETFVSTLGSEFVYLNIHTDAFQDGEISGRLAPAT
jgi:CHRD domain